MQCGDFRVTYASDERIFDSRLPVVALVAFVALLALVPLVAETYWLDVLNRIGIGDVARQRERARVPGFVECSDRALQALPVPG